MMKIRALLIAPLLTAGPLSGMPDALADRPCPPTRLISPPGTFSEYFGTSVATNGRFWFVGDALASQPGCGGVPLGCNAGAVHVYELVDGRLEFVQTLVPDVLEFFDWFGISLDADGDRLVAGSLYTDWPGIPGKGGGYVFEFDGDSWNQVDSLVPPEEYTGDLGGGRVAIDGDVVAVYPGSRGYRKIHLYTPDAEGWALSQIVESPLPLPDDAQFGLNLDLHNGWLVAAAHRDPTRAFRGGSVFVFRRDADGVYQFTQQILPPEPFEENGEFGFDLWMDGDTLAISARRAVREVEWQGAIFTYQLDGDQWEFQQEITHADPREDDELGVYLTLGGDTLLARIDRTIAGVGIGVLRFQRGADGRWREVDPLIPNPVQRADGYGQSMVVEGRYALLGADDERSPPESPDPHGAAYFFDLGCEACPTDLDGDGALTIFDYLAFFNAFDAADPIADFDGDGEFTLLDFLAFQAAFDAGCS